MAATPAGARHFAAPLSAFVPTPVPTAVPTPVSTPFITIAPSLLQLAVKSALLALLGAPLMPALAQSAPAEPGAAVKSAAELSEILVQARRDDAYGRNGSITVISADQLDKQNATDMSNIARYAPLISVPGATSGSGNIWDGAGNTGFNIRGIEGNRISLDVDGISLPDAAPKPDGNTLSGFGVARDYFDPETFREVRIGSGASPSGAGTPGLGGSVAFITRSPEDYVSQSKTAYADYKLGYNSANGSRMHAVTGAAQLGPQWKALLVMVHRDGEEADSKGSAVPNPDDWHSDAVLGKLSWTLARGHKLGFTFDRYEAQHDRVYANKLGASYPEGATQDASTKRTRYSLEHQYTPGAGLLFDTLDSRIYAQNSSVVDLTFASYITGGQPYTRNINTGFFNNSKGLGLDAAKQLSPNHSLSYGLTYEQQESRRPWLEDRTVTKTGVHQITMKNRMADMDTDKLSAYLRAEFGVLLGSHQVTLTPGLRGEQRKLTPQNLQAYLIAVPGAAQEIKQETDSFFTPSLNLSLELTPSLVSYAQYSRGTRLPSAAERTGTYDSFSYTGAGSGYAVLGNPKLQKETSNAVELGLKGAPTPGVEMSFAIFHTSYDNFIEYAPQPADPVNYPTISFGLYRPENLGKAKTWGGELSSHFNIGHWLKTMNGVSLQLAGGISHGSAENKLTGKKGELASTLPYKASAILAYDDIAKRGGAALAVTTLRGKQSTEDVIADTAATRFAVPGYTVADLSAYWNINAHASINAGIYNLGDKKYWDYASSRGLPAGATAVLAADIERQARPGRNYSVTLKLIY